MINKIFPLLSNKKWGEINFNNQAKIYKSDFIKGEWLEIVKSNLNVDYLYGGYMEDRSFLMQNCYQSKTKSFIHLGVDFILPEYTPVICPFNALVIHKMDNKDQDGGWGGRLIIKCCDHIPLFGEIFVFGHLDGKYLPEYGYIKKNTVLGLLAPFECNGGWKPHLHLQRISNKIYEKYKNLDDIDGYSINYDGIENDYKNPLK